MEKEEAPAGDGGGNNPPCAHEYHVASEPPFGQVSPEASFWDEEPILRTVKIGEVIERLGGVKEIERKWQFSCPDPTHEEIEELTTGEFGYNNRYKEFTNRYRENRLGVFLTHPAFVARPPAGTVINNRIMTGRLPIVRNGAELASMFEAEKTAVWHQHVLLTLMEMPGQFSLPDGRGGHKIVTVRLREVISPVRQALMQAALHTVTLSALTAIWRFKWRRFPTDLRDEELLVARRECPSEYFERINKSHPGKYDFQVLFDSEIRFNADGDILRNIDEAKRGQPNAPDYLPGTPRHPAFGSGHSTYSKAASEIMKVFLPDCWGSR
ncbi:hypothetical protein GCM10025880_43390 [Methylorubrum aminovorans]|uniref:hypothetical protein n=1 Tax=Methylorubrum aminovorans TaxID=269069 RepID=UPI0023E95C29|nr:hypothetical protein [Methylorubrum aminovorans]GMA77922.1 hypothetical protein GCM10025880_43390 [Methylorubrum aminovorans]